MFKCLHAIVQLNGFEKLKLIDWSQRINVEHWKY